LIYIYEGSGLGKVYGINMKLWNQFCCASWAHSIQFTYFQI